MNSDDFKISFINLLLLHFLDEGDMYGYEILKLVKQQSKEIFVIPNGTIYSAMQRLSEKGYVTDEEIFVSKRRSVRKYHIEPEGYKHYLYLYEKYKKIYSGFETIFSQEGQEKEDNTT